MALRDRRSEGGRDNRQRGGAILTGIPNAFVSFPYILFFFSLNLIPFYAIALRIRLDCDCESECWMQ